MSGTNAPIGPAGLAAVIAAVLVVGGSLAVVAPRPASPDTPPGPVTSTTPPGGDLPGLDADTLDTDPVDVPTPAEPVRREVRVVVELHESADLPVERLDELDVRRTYTRQDARYVHGRAPLTALRRVSRHPQVRAVRVRSPGGRTVRAETPLAPGVATVGARALHAADTAGGDVAVGVIDRGFRPSDPSIAGNVVAYRAFSEGGGDWRHGTAVASVVVDTAPNASLHLAAVGPSTTPGEYRRAVEWLQASGADVIVDSGSYFGVRTDAAELERVASAAAEDAVVVASAGNYARRHWAGTHGPNATGGEGSWVAFGGREGNALGNGTVAGRVTVSLSWNESGNGSADYDLYLFRERPGEDEPVAAGTRRSGSTERVSARLPRGDYYVAVRAHRATNRTRLELFASHRLANATAAGSLAPPATAAGVLAVGAVENGTVEPFSSRGPAGNRTGVDVVAPDDVGAVAPPDAAGTSYAAPYVAGTVALLVDRHPELSPAELRAVVRDSARDVGPPGPDPAAGHGVVDARAATVLAAERALVEGTATG